MASNAEVLARELLENPESILPESAMKHVRNAQKAIDQALAEIAKFADPEFVKGHPKDFKKLSDAIGPAASSSADFQRHVTKRLYSKLHRIDQRKASSVRTLERRLQARRRIDPDEINETRDQIMRRIRDVISSGSFELGGGVAAFPAAVAAGAAVVAAAVEVVTLVRSVTSSSYIDRLIREARINPQLLNLRHTELRTSVINPRITNVIRGIGRN